MFKRWLQSPQLASPIVSPFVFSSERCDDGTCQFGGVCVRSADGQSSACHCEDSCPNVYNPVCGSDGLTHDNDCRLKLAACRRRRNIRVAHNGECGESQMQRDVNLSMVRSIPEALMVSKVSISATSGS